jgi:hypothetical protein
VRIGGEAPGSGAILPVGIRASSNRGSHETATLEAWMTCASTPTLHKPARQPKAVAAGFEGQCNPRNRVAGPDCPILPLMRQAKQPFWARLQLLARLTLNTWNDDANQPTRLARLDVGNHRAILVQGDEGPAQVIWLGIAALR